MRLRMLGILLASAAALAFATVRPAFAGEDGADDQPAAHDDDGGSGKGDGGSGDHGGTTDRADPSTKTLPSHASATARNNAFGQQGAREKAAHAAARSAAVKAAQRAAQAHTPTLPAQAVAGRAHAHDDGGGKPTAPGSPGQRGLDVAAAHGAHGSPTSHPTGRP